MFEQTKSDFESTLKKRFTGTKIYVKESVNHVHLDNLKVKPTDENVDLNSPLNLLVEIPSYHYIFDTKDGVEIAKWYNGSGYIEDFAIDSNNVNIYIQKQKEHYDSVIEPMLDEMLK